MNKRFLGTLLALAMLVPASPALASHTNNYVTVPTEHDDQGRSVEPDFAKSSIFGGVLVTNKIYDPTPLDPIGAIPDGPGLPQVPGHSTVLAPGCTDDTGRQPSGLCGLYTIGANPQNAGGTLGQSWVIPPGQAGVRGMSGSAAPGRFSADKSTTFRFLDTIVPIHIGPPAGGIQYIEHNRKLDDSGARGTLASVNPAFGGDVLSPYTGMWSWYGWWTDRNGNGVIDELGPNCTGTWPAITCPPVDPNDEWVWVGNCFRFPSGPGLVRADNCYSETTQMLGWVYPGNHHTFSGGTVAGQGVFSSAFTSEFPARQVICAADIFHGRKLAAVSDGSVGGQLPWFCPGRYEDLDSAGELSWGDPILDDQRLMGPDFSMADRTGDPSIGVRQWVAGNGFVMAFFDQSLITTTVMVTSVFSGTNTCVAPCQPSRLPQANFADVDIYSSLDPQVDALLNGVGGVKDNARANWVFVREHLTGVDNYNDQYLSNAAISRDPIRGPIDDQHLMAGHGREPNTNLDSFPVARGTCSSDQATFNGWCTSYAAYSAARNAFVDVTKTRVGFTNVVLSVTNGGAAVGLSCYLCVAGGGIGHPVGDGTPKPVGSPQYAQSFAPGHYLFGGNVGLWKDVPQTSRDTILDPDCATYPNRPDETTACVGINGLIRQTDYTLPADGWVGNIVDATGYWRYRGYVHDTCTINGVTQAFPYAFCHPYRDGMISNPQVYAGSVAPPGTREWFGACTTSTFGPPHTPVANVVVLTVTPLDSGGNPSTWNVPAFVDRDFFNQRPDVANPNPWLAKLEDWTNRGAIEMRTSCAATTGSTSGAFGFNDLLVLPLGNLGQTVKVEVKAAPINPDAGNVRQPVTDVDVYLGWGA